MPFREAHTRMKLSSLFSPRPTALAGKRLYAAAAAQARQPELYERLGAPDTVEGRFELYTLHVGMVLRRLKGQGSQAAETAQAVFDAYVASLDDALREMGVGDLSVGKKMRKLGEAFYGRVRHYDEAFGALPDRAPLEAILQRTVLEGEGRRAEALADYAVMAMDKLERQPLDTFLQGDAQWPPI
jgi:cytochrome b pre-mRNA-processing protein 3